VNRPPRKAILLAWMGSVAALLAVCVVLWMRAGAKGAASPTGEPRESTAAPVLRGAARELDDYREVQSTTTETASSTDDTALIRAGPRVVVVLMDVDKLPVPNAQVEITSDGPPGVHAADAQGLCRLPVEPGPDLIVLRITAEGFVPVCLRYGRVERIELRMFRAIDVEGRVVQASDGAPIPGARVFLVPDYNTCPEQQLVVDADGSGGFHLAGVPLRQEVTWRAEAEGFAAGKRSLTLRDPPFEFELALARGVEVQFLVVDGESEAPIGDAAIERGFLRATTDALGLARSSAFLSLDEEQAYVSVTAPGFCTLRASCAAPSSRQGRRCACLCCAACASRVPCPTPAARQS
jgi:hypothetical protein